LKQAEAERARLAEARGHAEAYEQFSAGAVDQLLVFLRATVPFRRNTTPGQTTAALLNLRRSTNDLRKQGVLPSSSIGILEAEIGGALVYSSKPEEARELLNQAIADLKHSLAKNSDDTEVRDHLGSSLFYSGCLAEEAGQLEVALKYFEQAAAAQLTLEPTDSEFSILTALYSRLQVLADRLGQSGRAGEEDRSRKLSQQILQQFVGSDLASSTDSSSPGLETLRRLIERYDLKKMSSHEDKGIRYVYESFVARWLAYSVKPLTPFQPSSSAATYDRDPEAGAIALISAIRDLCLKLGLADFMVPATIKVVSDDAACSGGEQRKLGRLDDARATAARLMVIARQVVREYPNSAHSYFVLSEAHDQIKKNGFKSDDDNLIMEALVQAVEAAQRSLALDPDRIDTRHHLEKLADQLASIKADRKAASAALSQLPR
jgi:tetratricopeptide (TPR) repeat protein